MDMSPENQSLGRAYWSVCTAGLASSIGDGAVFVGFPILASTLTHDPRAIAGVAVAQRLPWLLLSLVTGVLADRLDRRRLISLVESLRMLTVLILGTFVAVHFHPLGAVYLAAFTLGSLETAFTGTLGAIVPGLVGRCQLGKANGYLYAAQMSGEGILGPATGGLLAAAALSLPFLFDGATFAVSATVLFLLLPRQPSPRRSRSSDRENLSGLMHGVTAEAAEGLRCFVSDPGVRLIAGYIAVLAFCQAAVFSVLVLWARQDLHTSRVGYGLLLTVAAIGTVSAAVVTGRVMSRFSPGRLIGVGGALAAGAYLVLGITRSPVVAAMALLMEGAAVSGGNVVSFAVRQVLIPPELLGRVGNAMRMCIFGAMSAGALAGGLLAHSFGLQRLLLIAGASQLAVVVLVWRPLVAAVGPALDLVDGQPATADIDLAAGSTALNPEVEIIHVSPSGEGALTEMPEESVLVPG